MTASKFTEAKKAFIRGAGHGQNQNCRVLNRIVKTLQVMARETAAFQRKINEMGVVQGPLMQPLTCGKNYRITGEQTGESRQVLA